MSSRRTSSFAGDVAKLVGGTGASQALALLAAPILSRLYSPEAWGGATVFASVIGVITVIGCLRYELAILLPDSDDEAANVLVVSLIAAGLTMTAFALLLLLGSDRLAAWLGAPVLAPFLWFIPPAAVLAGASQALNYWNFRTRHFGRLAVSRALQTGSTTLVQVVLPAVAIGHVAGLVYGALLGSLAATAVLGGLIWRDDRSLFHRSVSWSAIKTMVDRYRKFPLLDMAGSLLNAVSQVAPVIVLGLYFSEAIAGQFALATRVIYLPMTFIGGAISQVFFQRAAEVHSIHGDLAALTEDVFRRLFKITLLPSLLMAVAGQKLFVFVFGPQWVEAGQFAELLGVWMCFYFVGSPLTLLFIVMQRLEAAMVVHIVLLIARVVPLVAGGRYGDPFFALALYSAAGIVAYGGIAAWSLALAGIHARVPARDMFVVARRAVPIVAALWLLLRFVDVAPSFVLVIVSFLLLEHAWHLVTTDAALASMVGRRGPATAKALQ